MKRIILFFWYFQIRLKRWYIIRPGSTSHIENCSRTRARPVVRARAHPTRVGGGWCKDTRISRRSHPARRPRCHRSQRSLSQSLASSSTVNYLLVYSADPKQAYLRLSTVLSHGIHIHNNLARENYFFFDETWVLINSFIQDERWRRRWDSQLHEKWGRGLLRCARRRRAFVGKLQQFVCIFTSRIEWVQFALLA